MAVTRARSSSPWVPDAERVVGGVENGSTVGVGGFHFTRAPLAAGAVRRARLTFSSLDIFGLAPRFRRAVERGELELEDWTALALIKGLEAAGEQLGFEVLQAPDGSDLEAVCTTEVAAPIGH